MSRNSKVGGTKRRVLDVVGFTAIIVFPPLFHDLKYDWFPFPFY